MDPHLYVMFWPLLVTFECGALETYYEVAWDLLLDPDVPSAHS